MTPELLSTLENVFCQLIPFNKVLGARLESIQDGQPTVIFEMRPDLVGNYIRGTLHGGVISAVLDATGGLTAFLGVQERFGHDSIESCMDQFCKLGTIDFRVDYLRPGTGNPN